jgi:hypothetical protein
MFAAAKGEHIPVLSVLLEAGTAITDYAFQVSRDEATLRWCAEHGCSVDAHFIREVAHYGRVFQLDWAASITDISGFSNADTFFHAAAGDDVRGLE